MELVYLWIEDYKNIKKQGFNFSPNHKFELKKINGEYKLEDNFRKEMQNKNFFDTKGKIKNITAIVGANGSGKSSILQTICETLGSLKKNSENKFLEIFMIFKNEEDTFFIFNKCKFMINKLTLSDKKVIDFNVLDNLSLQFLYYDPIFTKKYIKRNENYKKNIDISLQNILMDQGDNNLYKFAIEETRKSIKFLTKYSKIKELKKSLKIKLPQILNINIKLAEVTSILEFKIELVKNVILEIKKELGNENLDVLLENEKNIEIFLNKNQKTNKKFIEDLEIENGLRRKLLELIDNKEENYFNKYVIKGIKFKNQEIEIELNEISQKTREKLLQFIEKDKLEIPLLNYSYDIEMSSGEKAILNLFSNFYDIKERNKMNENSKMSESSNIIILMDEPDSLLHPEWQRKFLSVFIEFIEELFKTTKNQKIIKTIQIITTSHSPFMASDLPKENVIMLQTYDKNDEEIKLDENDDNYQKIGNCKIKNNIILNTFGANIFDLYKDAFFLKSTFGEFSKNKIKNIIKDLTPDEEGNYGEIDKTKVKYIMESIGEPLLKNKLNKMWKNFQMWELSKNNNRMGSVEKKMKLAMNKYGLSEDELIMFRGFKGENGD